MTVKRKNKVKRQTKSAQTAKKNQHASLVEPLEPSAENEVADGLSAHVSVPAQGQLLGNAQLSPVQRQEVARQIGQTGGNQHLAKVIARMQNGA